MDPCLAAWVLVVRVADMIILLGRMRAGDDRLKLGREGKKAELAVVRFSPGDKKTAMEAIS